MKKISICASMPMHSYETATALIKSNKLEKYYTTVYNDNSLIYILMKKFLPSRLSKKVIAKKNINLDQYIKKYCEIEGLMFVGGGYIPILRKYNIYILRNLNRNFGIKVGKNLIKRNTRAVIAYDTYAKYLFDYLTQKSSKIIKILDMASVSSKVISEIIECECKKDYPYSEGMEQKKKVYSQIAIEENMKEILLADYILAGSKFVVNSLIETGVNKEKIKLLPYGIDTNKFMFKQKKYKKEESLIFLFVGRVEAAKGIWYLLEAFNDKRILERNIKLKVIGDIRIDKNYLKKYEKNISFEGIKLAQEMPTIYQEVDVYILSSLWEGFSFSLLEAMSSGTPVIATQESAAPEVVLDYKDGIVINSGSTEEIIKAVLWFDENREKIPKMSESARKKIVENFTLEHYYQRVNKVMEEIIENSRGRE